MCPLCVDPLCVGGLQAELGAWLDSAELRDRVAAAGTGMAGRMGGAMEPDPKPDLPRARVGGMPASIPAPLVGAMTPLELWPIQAVNEVGPRGRGMGRAIGLGLGLQGWGYRVWSRVWFSCLLSLRWAEPSVRAQRHCHAAVPCGWPGVVPPHSTTVPYWRRCRQPMPRPITLQPPSTVPSHGWQGAC